ncbi:hypothetical protein DFJ58DRAFT_752768 [Suillus subalutaceus]|uniref:uncharacterized protein n=1 Tax=Suillus subalutaceus TaxID=48586 RepID=UPI001B85C916|nr:uncharacterized protein DFJ58DRAFT_752768 [Suillus subalutaceus]KAG1877803.1 hypothetical protein DFJ58DRAFT_752768 [Suillus subalutaceus]
MDTVGWHAQRRARKEAHHFSEIQRGPDGRYLPVEEIDPLPDGSARAQAGSFGIPRPPSSPTPGTLSPVPPKYFTDNPAQNGSASASHAIERLASGSSGVSLAQMPAVERSRAQRLARMEPHLQFMVGPLLRYDTVDENGLWRGAALIVTADSGSSYEPFPVLTYQWDPEEIARPSPSTQGSHSSYDLGPHPADPHATAMAGPSAQLPDTNEAYFGDYKGKGNTRDDQTQHVTGQEIYVYSGNGGTFTFWRFPIQIQLGTNEICIKYRINGGIQLSFFVPALHQNMRWAAHSCNGFSAGVNPDDFRGPGFKSGYDPMWIDLLRKHVERPFHVLVGGGDQLYCDSLTREPEIQEWILAKSSIKKNFPLTGEIVSCVDRFFFNHYCSSFRMGAFARANSSIPMLNMCDDHGKPLMYVTIDGFGSYPEELQQSPVFKHIGTRGYFFYLLFQCFINPLHDKLDDRTGMHMFKSLILGAQGPYVGLPSHSFLSYLGPDVHILMLDCRAERKRSQVCSEFEYQKAFERIRYLPPDVKHLVVQLGIPIAYPRMVFLETALDSMLNPLIALGRSGTAGFSSFVNKFNADAELLDDLNDHWTAKCHKKERNWFIQQMQGIARMKSLRISFLSGDVHCAAVGVLKTLVRGNGGKNNRTIDVPPETDYRYMINVVTSMPPNGVIAMVSTLATKTHRTLHHAETDEVMLPLFTKEPNGNNRLQNKYIMGRRNWCAVSCDPETQELEFDIRVEIEKGVGVSYGYPVRSPPPKWFPGT